MSPLELKKGEVVATLLALTRAQNLKWRVSGRDGNPRADFGEGFVSLRVVYQTPPSLQRSRRCDTPT